MMKRVSNEPHNFLFFTTDDDEPPCSPRDFLNSSSYFSEVAYNPGELSPIKECLPTCFRREYFTKITEAQIESGPIHRFTNRTIKNKLGNPE